MAQMTYPIVLTALAGARCVVVGGGAVAERKVAGLLAAGARPLVVSPQLSQGLAALRDNGLIDHMPRHYAEDDLSGATIAFAATNDPVVNASVAAAARLRGLLINVADDGALGSFHTVAAVRRGALLLTASTGGQSPAMAARLRAELAAAYGPEYARALAFASAVRALPAAALPVDVRAGLVDWLCSEQAIGWLREACDDLVAARVQQVIDRHAGAAEVAP